MDLSQNTIYQNPNASLIVATTPLENRDSIYMRNIAPEVNNNVSVVNQTVNTVNTNVDTVNSNVSLINPNINTQIATIIETPVGAYVTISQGSVYQTVLSYTGSGSLQMITFQLGDSGVTSGCKLTIDGTVYAESTAGSPSSIVNGVLMASNVINSSNPYNFNTTNAAPSYNVGDRAGLFDIKFKTSIKIEAFSNSGTSSKRLINYLVTKNI